MAPATRLGVFLALVVSTGCATSGGLTRQDILQQYSLINQLSTEISTAEGNSADVLASEGLDEACSKLAAAIDYAGEAEKEKANQTAEEGLKIMADVRTHMEESRGIMEEVLDTRERAKQEGAPGLYPDQFKEADASLREATILIEHKEADKAKEKRPEILNLYSDLELRALKEGTLAAARAAIKHAEESEADDYAPKTFKAAEEELKLVTSVLEADRTQTDKANAHAARTIFLARRAEAVTELVKMFEEKEFTPEDIMLWYQDQLKAINEPLGGELPFDRPNQEVVQVLRETGESLLKVLADTRGMMEAKQTRIQELENELDKERTDSKQKLSEQAQKSALVLEREKEADKRFKEVRALFSPEEAEVLRKEKDVVIQVYGFYYPPGGSEIVSRNFGLMNRLVSAINLYPDSKLVISGHTDSKGNKARNLSLSKERARNVAQFLIKLGGMEPERISSEGYGETKPLASNDTKEGRTKNRRIEILIVNH